MPKPSPNVYNGIYHLAQNISASQWNKLYSQVNTNNQKKKTTVFTKSLIYFPNKTPNFPPNLFLKQNNQTDYITNQKNNKKKRIDDIFGEQTEYNTNENNNNKKKDMKK